MRLITWNCRVGGFRKKSAHIAPYQPDVLAVQEVEPLDRVKVFAGDTQPTFRDRWHSEQYPRRSIGLFSYTDTDLEPVDYPDPAFSFRRFEASHESLCFQVAAVWTYATKIRKNSYRQAHTGLTDHSEWIARVPTVVMGDFNANLSFRGDAMSTLLEITDALGLVSAYHNFFDEDFGKETRPTHFHHGKEEKSCHLDYCFLPKEWIPMIERVEVGTYSEWGQISDHVPLIVDLKLP